MDETVQLDKIVDDDVLNLLPVHICPVLPYEVEVLHQDKYLNLKLVFIMHE